MKVIFFRIIELNATDHVQYNKVYLNIDLNIIEKCGARRIHARFVGATSSHICEVDKGFEHVLSQVHCSNYSCKVTQITINVN